VEVLTIDEVSQNTEVKLGEVFWDLIRKGEKEIDNPEINSTLDSLLTKICESNQIDKDKIKLHLVNNNDVNAFTLPDNHLVLYTGLILATENEAELCSVLSHEIAHMELKHVMKKLLKEVGLTILVSITTGNESAGKGKEILQLLTSSAYDRNLEKEADMQAIDYLKRAKINPEHFANFLFKLAENESNSIKYLNWVSTHPNSEERAKYIVSNIGKAQYPNIPILSKQTWDKLKSYLENSDSNDNL
jgi:predicted Zn-dependent protease